MSPSAEPEATRDHAALDSRVGNATALPSASPWILNGRQDLLFFVATPLLIVPLIAILRNYLSVEDIALFVISFGALGHHLPGMLRAYGDRELFARFRVRFIVAPLFLLAVCGFFAFRNLNGLAVITLLWGTWHGAAQIYGFLRIYDAKVKSFAALTAKLDMAMCIAWFGLGILYSPDRMNAILTAFYDSGGPLIPGSAIRALQTGWIGVTVLITAAFLANWLWQWRQGRPPSTAKLLLMISSFGLWWYAMIGINNIILGVAMFEIFHDIQYLAIVWVYNVKRVETGHRVGGFTHFLFRRSWFLTGLYIGLVFAYGAIGLFGETVATEDVKLALLGLVTASGFLHFYFDGFIWKVREQSTREGLGMSGGLAEEPQASLVPGWLMHGLKWTLFVVPVAFLGAAEVRGVKPQLDREAAIVAAVPDSANAHNSLGIALAAAGRQQESIERFQQALLLNPQHEQAINNLGGALQESGRSEEAIVYLEKALETNSNNSKAHRNLGNALRAVGRNEEAVSHFEKALQIDPNFRVVHADLGVTLAELGQVELAEPHLAKGLPAAAANFALANAYSGVGRFEEAISYYREVLRMKPQHVETNRKLGAALAALGRPSEALVYHQEVLRLRPDDAQAHIDIAVLSEELARFDDALVKWNRALQLVPNNMGIMNNLAWLLATCPDDEIRDGQRAVQLATEAARLSKYDNPLMLGTLAAAQAEIGDFSKAVSWQMKAVDLAPEKQKDDFRSRLELYEAGEPFRQTTAND